MRKFILLFTMLIPMFGCAGRPSGQIVSYEYVYKGCMMYPIFSYELVKDASGVQTLNYTRNDGVVHSVVLPEDALGKIDSIAIKNRLFRLKEHYRPHVTIYDGYSWSFRIGYERESVYSGGTNAYPCRRKRAAIDEINKYLEGFTEPESE